MNTSHTLNTVKRACADLARERQPVTFTAIAAATGLSRSTLDRNQALHTVIQHHRHNAADGPITTITDEIGPCALPTKPSPIRVRDHDEQFRRLTHN